MTTPGGNPALGAAGLAANPAAPPAGNALPSRLQLAREALQRSRQALRVELMPPPRPAPASGMAARHWWRQLRGWPPAQVARAALRQWWQRQPWQPLGDTLLQQGREQLWPLLRSHPWASVGAAAALGAAVFALRPWRWHWLDRRLRRAPGAATGWLLHQLGSAPVQAALATLLAMLAAGQAASAPASAPPSPPGPPPMPPAPSPVTPASTPTATVTPQARATSPPTPTPKDSP